MNTIDRLNLAVCAIHEPPACRYCEIPCDPSTREYRGARVCVSCYDELDKLLLVKKGRNHESIASYLRGICCAGKRGDQ